jgi:hypothetical protein
VRFESRIRKDMTVIGEKLGALLFLAYGLGNESKHFSTAYVVTKNGFYWILPLALTAIVITSLVIFRFTTNQGAKTLLRVILLVGGVIALLGMIFTVGDYVGNSITYLRGHYSTIEGTVADFSPLPAAKGDYTESFSVNGRSFSYSDFLAGQGCFNHSSTYGGPVRQGLYVRIAYEGNCILRLDVATDGATH